MTWWAPSIGCYERTDGGGTDGGGTDAGGLRAACNDQKQVTHDTPDSTQPETRPGMLLKKKCPPNAIAAPSETPAQLQ